MGREQLVIDQGNFTAWGPQAARYMDSGVEPMRSADVQCGQELHSFGERFRDHLRQRRKAGWRHYVNEADRTEGTGSSGGEWVLIRKHLQSYPGRLATRGSKLATERGWVPAFLRGAGYTICIVSLYLVPTIGATGENLTRLRGLGGFLYGLRCPYLVLGDFNMTPQVLAGTGWLRLVHGKAIEPEGTDSTILQGAGRIIDFCVAAEEIAGQVGLKPDPSTPWRPHLGLICTLRTGGMGSFCRKLAKPSRMDEAAGPLRGGWQYYKNSAEQQISGMPQDAAYPYDEVAADRLATSWYSAWSLAADLAELDRRGGGPRVGSRKGGPRPDTHREDQEGDQTRAAAHPCR